MHEYPLTVRIIEIAEQHARAHDGGAVSRITLVIGESTGIVADSIALYFEMVAAGTLCEKAALAIERVKPRLRCHRCGALFERRPFSFSCPERDCDGQGTPTDIGREFYVKSIEVEER